MKYRVVEQQAPTPGSKFKLVNEGASQQAPEAASRARGAMDAGLAIDTGDLNTLTRPNFQPLTPAQQSFAETSQARAQQQQFEDQRQREDEDARIPEDVLGERLMKAGNGVTWGNASRLAAGVSTLTALASTPFNDGDIIDRKGISGANQEFLDINRVHQRRASEKRPIESAALEIIPALFQGKTFIDEVGKKLLPKTTALSNTARVVGTGAVGGATYMASQNESGTVGGALSDAKTGALYGAGGGALFKAGEMPARVAYRTAKGGVASISDALSSAIGRVGTARDRVADQVAVAAVQRSADRAGLTMEQVFDLVKKYEGKPAVLAEVIGQDAINALTALTRGLGKTSQKAQDIIEERAYGWYDRAKGDIEDATGFAPGQVDDIVEEGMTAGREKASPVYDQLFNKFKDVKSFPESLKRVNRLLRSPGMQRHIELADKAIRNASAKRSIPISKMSKMEYFDFIKQSLDDAIEGAVSKGESRTRIGESVRDLTELKDEFVKELDRLTAGAYSAAREVGGEAPRLRTAAADGQKAFGAKSPRVLEQTVEGTTEAALPALRAGMADDLATRVDKGNLIPGRFRRPDVANKVRAVFGEEAGDQLIGKMDAEATLRTTGSRWAPRMQSTTGTVMESGPTQMGDDLLNAGMNFMTGNKVGLLRQAINFARQRGFSQRQIDAIGDLLLSDPEEGLRRLGRMRPDGTPGVGGKAASAGNALSSPDGGALPSAPSANPGVMNKALAIGAGKAKPKPAPQSNAGPKPGSGTKAGLVVGGAGSAIPTADAQENDAEEMARAANERVSEIETKTIPGIESQMAILDDPDADPREVQRVLDALGFDLGETGIDGVIGPMTKAARNAKRTELADTLSTAREELATARAKAKELDQRAIFAKSKRGNELLREAAPWIGVGSGLLLAGFTRGRSVKKSGAIAKTVEKTANALLNTKPVSRAATGANSINSRAANVNEFWRAGGAGDNVPFKTLSNGEWRTRAKAAEPSQLYQPKKIPLTKTTNPYNSTDAGWMAGGVAEGQVAGQLVKDSKEKIKKAEADIEKYSAAGDNAGLERSLAELERARDYLAFATAAQRLGYGIAAGRAVMGLKAPYAVARPNIEAAEMERSLLQQSIKKGQEQKRNALALPPRDQKTGRFVEEPR